MLIENNLNLIEMNESDARRVTTTYHQATKCHQYDWKFFQEGVHCFLSRTKMMNIKGLEKVFMEEGVIPYQWNFLTTEEILVNLHSIN